MKTVLRLITREGSTYIDIPNPYNMIPRKNDNFVWQEKTYTVSWVEFDFDMDVLYIITIK